MTKCFNVMQLKEISRLFNLQLMDKSRGVKGLKEIVLSRKMLIKSSLSIFQWIFSCQLYVNQNFNNNVIIINIVFQLLFVSSVLIFSFGQNENLLFCFKGKNNCTTSTTRVNNIQLQNASSNRLGNIVSHVYKKTLETFRTCKR